MTDEIKIGNRNNADDRARIRAVRQRAREIVDLTVEIEPTDSDDVSADMEREIQDAHAAAGKMRLKILLDEPVCVRSSADVQAKSPRQASEYVTPGFKILGVPYGGPISGRDAQGEAFHPGTDIWLRVGDEVNLTYCHGFGPDNPNDWQTPPAVIGRAVYVGADERGHWFEPAFDPSEPLAARVLASDVDNLRASSGAVGHLVRMGEAGMIDVWPVGELAVFDVNEWRKPANDFAVVLKKSAPEMPEDVTGADDAEVTSVQDGDGNNNQTELIPDGDEKMDEQLANEIKTLVEQAVSDAVKPEKLGGILTSGQAPAYMKTANLGDPDPVEDFARWIITGEGRIKRHEVNANLPNGRGGTVKAALQEGTDSEGGYLVPADVLSTIIQKRSEMSLLGRLGVQVFTTDREQFIFPVEDSAMTRFSIVAEEADMSTAENEPTFASAASGVNLYKFKKLVKISEELDEDYNTGLMSYLSDAFARAWAATENYYVQVGSGSGAPQGVFVGGTAGLTLDSATAIGAAEIPELIGKLKIPYRDRAVMVMNRTTGAYLAGLTGNQFVFRTPPASMTWANGEDIGIGYPVMLTEDAAAIGAGNKSLLFGNFNFYGWVTNRSLRVKRLVELYAQTGQIGLVATFRAGGAVLQAEAFQYATHPTA